MMKNYEETIEKLKKYNQNEIVNIMSKVYTEEELNSFQPLGVRYSKPGIKVL